MNGNGNGPIPFRAPAVPIVGQPFTPTGGFITVMGRCNCGGAETTMLCVGGNPGFCPSCGRGIVIVKASVNGPELKIEGVGLVTKPAEVIQ